MDTPTAQMCLQPVRRQTIRRDSYHTAKVFRFLSKKIIFCGSDDSICRRPLIKPKPGLPPQSRPQPPLPRSHPPRSDTLAILKVASNKGLARAEVEDRRKENCYNEVAVQKEHPVLKFLGKFWGMSAWMLELIMVLSALLHKYSDLVLVSALLLINAVLSFVQEQRAAGVVETLRRRLQISSRVLHE